MSRFQSIQKHLALVVFLGSLGFASIVGLIAFSLEYRAQFRQARQLQDQLVATVQASAAISAFVANREIAIEVADGLLANPIIAAVEIDASSGFRHSRERSDVTPGETIDYPLLSPVDKVDRIGVLKVHQDAQEINQRALEAALAYAGLLVLQIAVSSGLLMLLFGRVVGNPLKQLARMLEAVPPGSHQRLPVLVGHERDEIGMLVQSSNTLLGAVEQAIHEERRLQAEVDEMETHYRRIFDTTNVGIMILRPGGALLNCNATLMSRIIGVRFDATTPDRCRDFIDTIFCAPEKAWAMVWEARDTGQSVANDLRLRSDDGQERWAHCMISVSVSQDGNVEMIEGVLYDVTARRLRESEARRAAEVDLLTGLANRRGMEHFVDQSIHRAEQENNQFGLMLIDLDGFKAVNDTHGHAAGDVVLKTIGLRLNKRLRRSHDLAARLGGDEFTVIITETRDKPGLLREIGEELLDLIRQPIEIGQQTTVHVGASIGIASYPVDGLLRKQLIDAADAAMYSVKRSGKNRVMLADGQNAVGVVQP